VEANENGEREEKEYTEAELNALSANVLKALLKEVGQKTSGVKKDLVARVLAWQNAPESEVKNVIEKFIISATKGESPIHIFYKTNFNPVDLADGYYYTL